MNKKKYRWNKKKFANNMVCLFGVLGVFAMFFAMSWYSLCYWLGV